jgi:hypothetical protein
VKYVLCRWDVAAIGEKREYCAKPNAKGSNYCAEHAARLPFWPADAVLPEVTS